MPSQTATRREPRVHQVTLVRIAWIEEEMGIPGALTLRLSLDSGVKEYVVRAEPEDAAALVELLAGDTDGADAPDAPWASTPPTRWAEASFMRT